MTAMASTLSSRGYDYRSGEPADIVSEYSASSNRWSSVKDIFVAPTTEINDACQDILRLPWSNPPTVDAKRDLLSQLLDYQSLPDDWDGYGGKAASLATVMDAVHFLRRLPSRLPMPKPMIAGSGVIGLYWEGNDCYASIDFDGSGYYCYIADAPDEENGEDAVAVDSPLPQPLAEVIADTSDFL